MRTLIGKIALLSVLGVLLANFSCARHERTEPKSKTNSPPLISSISILPEKPTQESEINLFVRSHDPEGDPVTFQYRWIRNNEEIPGANDSSLKNGSFKKGDLIKVRVVPSDGKVDGIAVLSSAVKILNSSPVIQEASIEPKVAYGTDRLKANVKSSDGDGDLIYYTYQWETNGVVLNEESAEVLKQGRFKKGDSIAVTVTPDDRENLGKPKKSDPIIILNSPPIFVSSPPTSVEGTKYAYQVKTNDPDNDLVSFTLKANPKGMEINKNTGLIQWEIRKEDKGNHPVEIEVSDDAGAKTSQQFEIKVDLR